MLHTVDRCPLECCRGEGAPQLRCVAPVGLSFIHPASPGIRGFADSPRIQMQGSRGGRGDRPRPYSQLRRFPGRARARLVIFMPGGGVISHQFVWGVHGGEARGVPASAHGSGRVGRPSFHVFADSRLSLSMRPTRLRHKFGGRGHRRSSLSPGGPTCSLCPGSQRGASCPPCAPT
ncbi:hypothetical protein NDU88_006540 [Pleurodeles waltl]|uniref:Uncharacterized protein n=1 Tax=Pleurodeles waltl TaxID=8319 RepID=A0AAV7LSV3_PLEWA|nr:hypothetical protein NDU88_006540 [Pleurodeles waltl]